MDGRKLLLLLVALALPFGGCHNTGGWETLLATDWSGPIRIADYNTTAPPGVLWTSAAPFPETPSLLEHVAYGKGVLAAQVPFRATVPPGPAGVFDYGKIGIGSERFSVPKRSVIKYVAVVSGSSQNNSAQPFGPDIDTDDDPRLGNVNFNLIDLFNLQVFGFVLVNKGIYIYLARLPTAAITVGGPPTPYVAWAWAYKVRGRIASQSHRLSVEYDRGLSHDKPTVTWRIEGEKVFEYTDIGKVPKGLRRHLAIYYTAAPGATETLLEPEGISFVFGASVRLDNREWSKGFGKKGIRKTDPKQGLVQNLDQKPELGYVLPTSFVYDAEASRQNERTRLWGQGASLIIYKVRVSRKTGV